jgi:hypothetical protein
MDFYDEVFRRDAAKMGVIVNSPVIICTAFVDMANRLDFAEPC